MYEKLLEVQKKVGAVTKDKQNPFFKSNYADINNYIDVLKPILNEVGLVVLQPLDTIDGVIGIKTLVHDAENNDCLDVSFCKLPENGDPQKMGAIITYFRRYALQSLFFLQAEDDDANSVSLPQNDPQSTNVPRSGSGYQNPTQGSGAAEYKDCPNKAKCGGRIKGNFDLCYTCNQAKKNGNPVVMNNTGNTNQADEIRMEDIPF